MAVYFLVPVFNESPNIPELAVTLTSALPGEKKFYVFVDDCSTDDTLAVIRAQFPSGQLHIITKESNGGPGDSFNRGFSWILTQAQDEDLVVTIEGDNTSDPEILPHMFVISGLGYDLVLASPYAQTGGFEETSFFRKFLSAGGNILMRMFFGLKVLTLSSFYRIHRVSLLRRIQAKYPVFMEEKGFLSVIELLIKAVKCEAKVIEVPMVLHSAKRKGKSKMKKFKTSMAYLRFMFTKRF